MERQYDKQGNYFHHLVKLAGWTEKRVMGYLIKKFKKTHFNALDAGEKREAISTMKFYADKNKQKRESKMRQLIMATTVALGYDKEWLHDMMEQWGFGRSLRALGFTDLLEVRKTLIRKGERDG